MPASEATGVVVTEVNRGSPAARIGLQPRDIVVELNGEVVTSTEKLAALVGEDPSIWRVEIERDAETRRKAIEAIFSTEDATKGQAPTSRSAATAARPAKLPGTPPA